MKFEFFEIVGLEELSFCSALENTGDIDFAYKLVSETLKVTADERIRNKLNADLYSIKATIDLTCLNSQKNKNCDKKDYNGNDYFLDKKKWKPSYLVGNDVKAMGPMHKVLPERTFEKMLQKAVEIPQYKG